MNLILTSQKSFYLNHRDNGKPPELDRSWQWHNSQPLTNKFRSYARLSLAVFIYAIPPGNGTEDKMISKSTRLCCSIHRLYIPDGFQQTVPITKNDVPDHRMTI
ncbi:uncharacterized protein RSE6_03299 [Rhynchosporium secalis]|uniref:Uncharacterized protein n=1 Tax=Rhynchosporium secalis TaxID=38038 RepID=A0A1E1M2H0_RHYSE|nr:uncharacterized protein RSE6_03299 [Rhynchosporium secalis]